MAQVALTGVRRSVSRVGCSGAQSWGAVARWFPLVLGTLLLTACRPADRQRPPPGLARRALAQPVFAWIEHPAPPLRAYFLVGSYAASHRDSLVARLETARRHAFEILDRQPDNAPMDVFYLESRLQMETLLGRRPAGFAEPETGTVLLMTNPDWRVFDHHEVMHVVAERSWGPAHAGADWLREGLAQFADGHCGRHTNEQVANGLAAVDGWIPLTTLVQHFRTLPDLTAYLEAASLAGYLHRVYGVPALRAMWQGGPAEFERVSGRTLSQLEQEWRGAMATLSARPGPEEVAAIRKKGCG